MACSGAQGHVAAAAVDAGKWIIFRSLHVTDRCHGCRQGRSAVAIPTTGKRGLPGIHQRRGDLRAGAIGLGLDTGAPPGQLTRPSVGWCHLQDCCGDATRRRSTAPATRRTGRVCGRCWQSVGAAGWRGGGGPQGCTNRESRVAQGGRRAPRVATPPILSHGCLRF